MPSETEAGRLCRYCGEDYTDPNGIASDGYMLEGHLLHDCEQVPEEIREDINYAGVVA